MGLILRMSLSYGNFKYGIVWDIDWIDDRLLIVWDLFIYEFMIIDVLVKYYFFGDALWLLS